MVRIFPTRWHLYVPFIAVIAIVIFLAVMNQQDIELSAKYNERKLQFYQNTNDTSPKIDKTDGALSVHSRLTGSVFCDAGDVIGFTRTITTSVIHSFSQAVLQNVKKIFQDPTGDNVYHATLPALLRRNGRIILVQRIWLGQYELLEKHKKNVQMINTWQENYLYYQEFDENYNPVSKGEILGIPTTTNIMFQYRSDGPMDPRLITINQDMFIVFHTWANDVQFQGVAGRVHLWNFEENAKVKLEVTELPLMRTEINWTPVVKNGTLYLLYSLDPIRVLRCSHHSGECKLVYTAKDHEKHMFNHTLDHLRGGTPFIEYQYPYYISMAHSCSVTTNNWVIYSMHLVMIAVEPVFRIVYVSNPVEVNRELLYSVPVVRNFTVMAPFVYPVGMIQWSEDVFDIGVHLNDFNSHVIRLTGVEDIIQRAMLLDRHCHNKNGPAVRRVQKHVIRKVYEMTGQRVPLEGL